MSIRNRLLPGVVWVGIGLVWGTTWGVIRIGLRDLEPLTFAASRTVLAAVTLLAVAQIVDGSRRPKRREVWFWMAIGLPQIAVPYALIFWAEQYISSGLTAILFATFPAFTTVAAHFLLRDERLSLWKASGTALALVSVVLLVGPTRGAMPPPPIAAVSAVLVAVLVVTRRPLDLDHERDREDSTPMLELGPGLVQAGLGETGVERNERASRARRLPPMLGMSRALARVVRFALAMAAFAVRHPKRDQCLVLAVPCGDGAHALRRPQHDECLPLAVQGGDRAGDTMAKPEGVLQLH